MESVKAHSPPQLKINRVPEKELAAISDVLLYVGIFFCFYLFLKKLLGLAKLKMEKPHATLKACDFYSRNGYSYDFAMVFEVLDEEKKAELTEFQTDFSLKKIIDKMTLAGLETYCYFSCQRDEIYLKIRGDMTRLLDEAARIDYVLRLDEERLRIKIQAGKRTGVAMSDDEGDWKWKPINITDEYRVSDLTPWQYIYGPYSMAEEVQNLYKKYQFDNECEHLLKEVDR
jgi:hypothetical protein